MARKSKNDSASSSSDPLDEFVSVVAGLQARAAAPGRRGSVTLTKDDLRALDDVRAIVSRQRLEGGGSGAGDSGHTLRLGLEDLRLIFRALCGCADMREGFLPQGPKGNVTEAPKPPPTGGSTG